MDKIVFETDEGTQEYYLITSTRIAGRDYILVSDKESVDDEEVYTYVMKDVSSPEETEARYEFVDDDEAEKVFDLMMEELEE